MEAAGFDFIDENGDGPGVRLRKAALRRALETAGIEFIDNNGGGEGVRFRKPQRFNKKQQP